MPRISTAVALASAICGCPHQTDMPPDPATIWNSNLLCCIYVESLCTRQSLGQLIDCAPFSLSLTDRCMLICNVIVIDPVWNSGHRLNESVCPGSVSLRDGKGVSGLAALKGSRNIIHWPSCCNWSAICVINTLAADTCTWWDIRGRLLHCYSKYVGFK